MLSETVHVTYAVPKWHNTTCDRPISDLSGLLAYRPNVWLTYEQQLVICRTGNWPPVQHLFVYGHI